MRKRLLFCLLCVSLLLALGGCWNYRGLDQMNIVVGVAVDFDPETNLYKMSYEVADVSNANKGSAKGKIIESEGKTLFDAVRNAKRKEQDRLFFGSAHIVIVSGEVARQIGLSPVIDWFLRDGECREVMCMALSQEDSAKAMLQSAEESAGIVSATLYDIISEDNHVTSSTTNKRLYQVYNMLESKRRSAVLPALRKTGSEEKRTNEINGVAIFNEDKLAGFLTPEESRYLLYVEKEMKGGILTLAPEEGERNGISLEIFGSKTQSSFSYEEGKVIFKIKTDTRVSLAEVENQVDPMNRAEIAQIEDAAARMIEDNIANLIAKVQTEYRADIFGFGEMIYKRNLKLWRLLEPHWEEIFPTLEVRVSSYVHVINSAFIK